MPSLPHASASSAPGFHQLRFVFQSSAPLFRFIPEVTSGDIARIWSEIADRGPERPVAVDVTFAATRTSPSASAPEALAWLPNHLAWGRDAAE